jgi:hypothetical protein
MTALPRQLLRVLPALALLAFGCQSGDGGDSTDDRERVQRVVASYVAAYLDGRGEDACALYTAELRARIERAALRRGVRSCGRALELASGVLQTGQSGELRRQVRERLADPDAVRVRVGDDRAFAAVELPGTSSLSASGLVLERRDDEWRIARVGARP